MSTLGSGTEAGRSSRQKAPLAAQASSVGAKNEGTARHADSIRQSLPHKCSNALQQDFKLER